MSTDTTFVPAPGRSSQATWPSASVALPVIATSIGSGVDEPRRRVARRLVDRGLGVVVEADRPAPSDRVDELDHRPADRLGHEPDRRGVEVRRLVDRREVGARRERRIATMLPVVGRGRQYGRRLDLDLERRDGRTDGRPGRLGVRHAPRDTPRRTPAKSSIVSRKVGDTHEVARATRRPPRGSPRCWRAPAASARRRPGRSRRRSPDRCRPGRRPRPGRRRRSPGSSRRPVAGRRRS